MCWNGPDGGVGVGAVDEAELRRRSVDALGLAGRQADEYFADMWDWYCGELDEELMAFARGLRPTCVTAILSNSADGARREEEARYRFAATFDPILYSHEIGLVKPDPRVYELTCARLGLEPGEVVFLDDAVENVAAASTFGMHGVLHRSTRESILAVQALVDAGGA